MGDKRPVARSGKNDGRVDYSTAQAPQPGIGSTPHVPVGEERKCAYLDRVATLPKVGAPAVGKIGSSGSSISFTGGGGTPVRVARKFGGWGLGSWSPN